MSMKLSSFDALTQQNKINTLTHIKKSPVKRKGDFLLVLRAFLDKDQQVRLAAKFTYSMFVGEPYYLDFKGLSYEQIKEKISATFKEVEGCRPRLVEWRGEMAINQLSKDLQNRSRKAELHNEWEGTFSRSCPLLNSLREDTQQLISAQLQKGETFERAFLGFFHASLLPFRDLLRSLDSSSSENAVNLLYAQEDIKESLIFEEMMELLERPVYSLILLSNQHLHLFVRDHLKTSRGAWFSLPFPQMRSTGLQKNPSGWVLEIETEQELVRVPRLKDTDAQDLEKMLREKSIDAIQADEEFIERDFDKELRRLEMLFKAKTLAAEDYSFRKARLKKMELEKFSDTNVELMLAKRFTDAEFGKKVDEQLLKRFTQEKTIMFTDIVGYSVKAAEKELIDTMTLLAVHDRTLLPTIARYNGTLIKKIGDALMVKFETALEACMAARDMQGELIRFNRESPEKILIRIGINTGTVFVKGEDVFGDAVNMASRMETMAEPGKIYLTETTQAQIAGKIPCRDCGSRRIKGLKTVLRVFSLVDETGADAEMIAFAQEMGLKLTAEAEESAPAGPQPVSTATPASETSPLPNSLTLCHESIHQAILHYKNAVHAGSLRDASLEHWFDHYYYVLRPPDSH